ncbi:MAG: DUF2284 domain-containing protein [Candidatus Coatesbacteria bacterium]|nr:DUF2284 domain-containing protein [Candidatus Coatesbacteria bacterium]
MQKPEIPNSLEQARNVYRIYAERALQLGALDALIISIDSVVFDHRTILKCMYGCDGWNNSWVCPSAPKALMPWEAEPVLKRYSWALIVHSDNQKGSQDISFAIESQAYVDGYYFAFSMSDCIICETCAYQKGKPCVAPERARPAMQGMGIDVFATAHGLNLPIKTLRDPAGSEKQNWYSLIFFE